MFIYSLEYDTFSDYDGNLNATVATLGCNFRCGYCHNPHLIFAESRMEPETVLTDLKENFGFYDSVCVTGGEPTLHGDELVDFIKKIKDIGYKVKLDTNGSNPQVIQELMKKNLVDYVAMDIKGTEQQYPEITGYRLINRIQKSIDLIKTLNNYEFRTTAVPKFHQKSHMEEIGNWLNGSKKYTLQQFRSTMGCLDKSFENEKTYSKEELNEFKKVLEDHFDEVIVKCK